MWSDNLFLVIFKAAKIPATATEAVPAGKTKHSWLQSEVSLMISYSETLYKQQTEKDLYESGQVEERGWKSVEKSSQCPEKTLRLTLTDEVRVNS